LRLIPASLACSTALQTTQFNSSKQDFVDI